MKTEKLKVVIDGKLTEIDFKQSKELSKTDEEVDEKMDKSSYKELYKYLKGIQKFVKENHGRVSYQSLKETFYQSIEYLALEEQDLILEWSHYSKNYKTFMNNRRLRLVQSDYENVLNLDVIKEKLKEFILMELEQEVPLKEIQ